MASTYSIIGQPVPARVDGTGKVTGVTRYADDLFLPRMLYGKLLRSPHPHARILSIDISKAAALPGVFAVITGADVPQPYSPQKNGARACGACPLSIGRSAGCCMAVKTRVICL